MYMKRNCLICGKCKQKDVSTVLLITVKKDCLQKKNALQFELNNPMLPKKVQKEKIKTSIENLTYTLKRNTDITMTDDTKDDIKFLVKRFTDDANRVCAERSNKSLHNTYAETV